MIVTDFGERRNLVRESKMFVKDEAKVFEQSRCRVKTCISLPMAAVLVRPQRTGLIKVQLRDLRHRFGAPVDIVSL